MIPLLAVALTTTIQSPNVLVIITDDQGYGDLSLHGNPHLQTPHIDQLARESARFERFYVSPLCAPTRASLLTGRYSLRTGVRGVASGEETMRSQEQTLAELFATAGYRSGLFGKWHNGEHFPHDPIGQGFQQFLGTNLGHWNNYFDTTLRQNNRWVKTRGYITDVVTDAAMQFLAANTKPFFCVLSIPTPHSPFQVPEADFQRLKQRGLNDTLTAVYAMCENIDQNVGRILQQLDKQKQRENTVVLFLTDNGPNGNRYNGDMRGIKGSEHEGGCRVPCFLRYPARWPTGRNIPTVSAHIDVLPTLCELCSIPTTDPKQLDGRSLVPLLMGETLPDRTLFFRHSVPTTARPGGAVRTERYRMVRPAKQWQLFDMIQDPGESHDLSKQKPEIVQNLTRQYDAWLKSVMHELGEKPILEIGHPQENPVELSTANSTYTGGPKFYGKHANNNWLVDWSAPTAQANWTVQNKTPGRYKVRLRYLLDAKNPATATVTIASATTSGTLPPATPQQVPSPDRVPRDEVPEMIWATADLGTITIPSGQQMIRLEAQRELAQKLHIQRLIFEAE